jgi:maltose 6'-phosphate phosphatase
MPALPLRFLWVRNTIARPGPAPVQELSFALAVDRMGFGKSVTVHWSGEDGLWHELPARYAADLPDGRELWRADHAVVLARGTSLPGDIRFSARLDHDGRAWWDSRFGQDYDAPADSGVQLLSGPPAQILDPSPALPEGARSLPVAVAVRQDLAPTDVYIHWTTDAWKTARVSHAILRRDWWFHAGASAARNPNRAGVGIWAARLPLRDAAAIEYAAEIRTGRSGILWDNAGGLNHRARRGNLRVLTLNLHTWQEDDQLRKFETIAKAIAEERIDLVCFQEVAEPWNGGAGDWSQNAANIINSHLPTPYHIHADWSHIGFDRWREGLAILSRHPFVYTDSGYVSDETDPHTIHSRRVVMAQIRLPHAGLLNVFSAHLSWAENGFDRQFDRLLAWMDEKHPADGAGTLLCGDFNIDACSPSFERITQVCGYEEQILKIQRPDAFQHIFRARDAASTDVLAGDRRIDYIWLSPASRLRCISASPIFVPGRYDRVSDHPGYLAEFEIR